MAATSIIYRRELGSFLRSPFAWVIATLVLIIDGIFFRAFVLRGEQLSALVLERFFWFSSGMVMFAGILLSFRLIAEERTSHSMVLLNTSPVRDSQIIAGKFLAALTFLAILLVLSIYMPLLIKVRGKITGSQILEKQENQDHQHFARLSHHPSNTRSVHEHYNSPSIHAPLLLFG
jgi:ABC-2 type transport system permease protein